MIFRMEDVDDAVPKGQPRPKLCVYAENNKEKRLLEAFAEYFEPSEEVRL